MLVRSNHITRFLAMLLVVGNQHNNMVAQTVSKKIEIRGIYGSPEAFWKKNVQVSQLGVNAVFVHSGSIKEEMMTKAKAEGLMVFAEFATLNGKSYVDSHPEAWPIDKVGEKVPPATWFMGVCPTEPGFKQYRTNELIKLLRQFDLNGIWMDYLHWHAQFEDPNPILPETCFCGNCLAGFQSVSGIKIPEGSTPTKADWILKNHSGGCPGQSVLKNFFEIFRGDDPRVIVSLYYWPKFRKASWLNIYLFTEPFDVGLYPPRVSSHPLMIDHR